MDLNQISVVKEHVLNMLFPPQCLKCSIFVNAPGMLCSPCWNSISFIEGATCHACGLPFEFDLGPEVLCGVCAQEHPAFDRARAVMIYNEASKGIILSFKHGDQTHTTPTFGKWLHRAGHVLANEADLIVPVPLHWSRLFHRRYNQAALLAIAFGRVSGLPVFTNVLRRHKKTASQGHKTRAQRHRNLIGAFSVSKRALPKISGKRIILIDDVLTTGATAINCAKTLRRAGAKSIDVLTLARVVRADTASSPNGEANLSDF